MHLLLYLLVSNYTKYFFVTHISIIIIIKHVAMSDSTAQVHDAAGKKKKRENSALRRRLSLSQKSPRDQSEDTSRQPASPARLSPRERFFSSISNVDQKLKTHFASKQVQSLSGSSHSTPSASPTASPRSKLSSSDKVLSPRVERQKSADDTAVRNDEFDDDSSCGVTRSCPANEPAALQSSGSGTRISYVAAVATVIKSPRLLSLRKLASSPGETHVDEFKITQARAETQTLLVPSNSAENVAVATSSSTQQGSRNLMHVVGSPTEYSPMPITDEFDETHALALLDQKPKVSRRQSSGAGSDSYSAGGGTTTSNEITTSCEEVTTSSGTASNDSERISQNTGRTRSASIAIRANDETGSEDTSNRHRRKSVQYFKDMKTAQYGQVPFDQWKDGVHMPIAENQKTVSDSSNGHSSSSSGSASSNTSTTAVLALSPLQRVRSFTKVGNIPVDQKQLVPPEALDIIAAKTLLKNRIKKVEFGKTLIFFNPNDTIGDSGIEQYFIPNLAINASMRIALRKAAASSKHDPSRQCTCKPEKDGDKCTHPLPDVVAKLPVMLMLRRSYRDYYSDTINPLIDDFYINNPQYKEKDWSEFHINKKDKDDSKKEDCFDFADEYVTHIYLIRTCF